LEGTEVPQGGSQGDRDLFLIIDLAEGYRYTVVGTNNYKYVWIMARAPVLSKEDYMGILDRLAERGYKIADIKLMPRVW
jgi:apolipoprotein D and lipocalin family protein